MKAAGEVEGCEAPWRGLTGATGTIATTAAVFVCAALLGLWLVGPRYEARIVLKADPAEARAGAREMRLTFDDGQPIARRIVSYLTDEGRTFLPPALPERIAVFFAGETSARLPEAEGESPQTSRSWLESGDGEEQVVVVASASAAREASERARSVSDELARRITQLRLDPHDEAAVERAREAVADLVRRIDGSAVSIEAEDTAVAGLEILRNTSRDLARRREGLDARVARLQDLADDPGSAAVREELDPDLSDALAARASLQAAVSSLEASLPEDSPRLRIARQRLQEIDSGLRASALRALDETRATREEMRERAAELREAIDALELRIETAQANAAMREELRLAEIRLADLLAARSSAVEIARREQAREAPRPILATSAVAGGAGLLAGTLATLLRRWARRRGATGPSWPIAAKGEPAPKVDAQWDPSDDERRGDVATLEEVVFALASGAVSRVLVAGDPNRGRPASLDLARRLVAADRTVLLVDLSHDRSAARAGRASASPRIVEGDPAVEREATRRLIDEAEADYDQIVIECGALSANCIAAFADPDSAVLLADPAAAMARADEFAEAGLEILTLEPTVSDRARAPSSG